MSGYFTKNEASTMKSVFDKVKNIDMLSFNDNNCKSFNSFFDNGHKFSDLVRNIKNKNVEINFDVLDAEDQCIISAIMKDASDRNTESLKLKEIEKDRLKAEKAIMKTLNREDKIKAAQVVKDAIKYLKNYDKTIKKSYSEHKKQMKIVFKSLKKSVKELAVKKKEVAKKEKAAAKEEKKRALEIKKAEKAAKKAKKEAEKANKEAEKANKGSEKDNNEDENTSDIPIFSNSNETNEEQQSEPVSTNNTEEMNTEEDSSSENEFDKEEYINAINKMKIPALKEELSKKNLSTTGKKADLINRLLAAVN